MKFLEALHQRPTLLMHTLGLGLAIGLAYAIRIPARIFEGTASMGTVFSLSTVSLLLAGGGILALYSMKKERLLLVGYGLFVQLLGWLQVVGLIIVNLSRGENFQPLVAAHGLIAYVAILAVIEIIRALRPESSDVVLSSATKNLSQETSEVIATRPSESE